MPIAPITLPGSSLVASSAVTRSGVLVISRNVTQSDLAPVYPNEADFSFNALTVPSNTLPSLLVTVWVETYISDSENITGVNNTCLPAVCIVPVIATGLASSGYPLCMPIMAFANTAATFTIRAPIEKIGFRAYNGVSQWISLDILPALPDLCWTKITYTVSASQ